MPGQGPDRKRVVVPVRHNRPPGRPAAGPVGGLAVRRRLEVLESRQHGYRAHAVVELQAAVAEVIDHPAVLEGLGVLVVERLQRRREVLMPAAHVGEREQTVRLLDREQVVESLLHPFADCRVITVALPHRSDPADDDVSRLTQ